MYMASYNKIRSNKRKINEIIDINNINNISESHLARQDKSEKISCIDNHIYFYSDVNSVTILELNKTILRLNKDLLYFKNNVKCEYDVNIVDLKIYLHINSMGGYVTDAFSGVDCILNSQIPIISIIEGYAASAATFLSVVCHQRCMTKHSSILIHQLSGGSWGTYEQMNDEFQNSTYLQKKIKNLYLNHCRKKMTKEKLDKFLKRDLMFNFKKSRKLGLVDELI